MFIEIEHRTELRYSTPVSESQMEIRMAPRATEHQTARSFSLSVGPAAPIFSYTDWLGNLVHHFSVIEFHEEIRIAARSVVETHPRAPDARTVPDPFPPAPPPFDLHDFLSFGGPVRDSAALRSLAASLVPAGTPRQGEVLWAITTAIRDRFHYEKNVTNSLSTIDEILAHGKGVCQDFAQLQIGLLRSLGIPARYVSGFVHKEEAEYRGRAQTHAWCEAWFPSAGWVGFDPTNRCQVGENFVVIGVGRAFTDVPPNRGVYRGEAREEMRIAVATRLAGGPAGPPGGFHYGILDVPCYVRDPSKTPDREAYQQEMQQQQ